MMNREKWIMLLLQPSGKFVMTPDENDKFLLINSREIVHFK